MTLRENMLQILQTNTINSTPWILADQILRLGVKISDTTISQLANMCSVSEPTVSRFVSSAGFINYTDMRDAARTEALALSSSGFHISESKLNLLRSNPTEYLHFFLRELDRTMGDFVTNIDVAKFDAFITAIDQAPRVFIFSFSTSRLMADIIQNNLARYGKIIYVPVTDDEQLIEAKQLKKGDLAIVISTHGYYISKSTDVINLISRTPANTWLFTQNPGITEAYIFNSVLAVTHENDPLTGTYILLLATEFLVRRYAETIGNASQS